MTWWWVVSQYQAPVVLLLQGVLRNLTRCKSSRDIVLGCGMGASRRELAIFGPPSMQQSWEAIVAFDAARLGSARVAARLPGRNGRQVC